MGGDSGGSSVVFKKKNEWAGSSCPRSGVGMGGIVGGCVVSWGWVGDGGSIISLRAVDHRRTTGEQLGSRSDNRGTNIIHKKKRARTVSPGRGM